MDESFTPLKKLKGSIKASDVFFANCGPAHKHLYKHKQTIIAYKTFTSVTHSIEHS